MFIICAKQKPNQTNFNNNKCYSKTFTYDNKHTAKSVKKAKKYFLIEQVSNVFC